MSFYQKEIKSIVFFMRKKLRVFFIYKKEIKSIVKNQKKARKIVSIVVFTGKKLKVLKV